MAGSHLKHNNILADIVAGYKKYKTELKEYMLTGFPTWHKHPGVGNERYTAKRWAMSDILIVYIFDLLVGSLCQTSVTSSTFFVTKLSWLISMWLHNYDITSQFARDCRIWLWPKVIKPAWNWNWKCFELVGQADHQHKCWYLTTWEWLNNQLSFHVSPLKENLKLLYCILTVSLLYPESISFVAPLKAFICN